MLELDHDRRDRASESDGGARNARPSEIDEATDEELSDAIAGIELDDPHSAIGHGVASPDASTGTLDASTGAPNSSTGAPDSVFDLDGDRAPDADDDGEECCDARDEADGPLRSLLSRVL